MFIHKFLEKKKLNGHKINKLVIVIKLTNQVFFILLNVNESTRYPVYPKKFK